MHLTVVVLVAILTLTTSVEAAKLKNFVESSLSEVIKTREELGKGNGQKVEPLTYSDKLEKIADGFPSDCSAWKDGPNYSIVESTASKRRRRKDLDDYYSAREQAGKEMMKAHGIGERPETDMLRVLTSLEVISVGCSDTVKCEGKFKGADKKIEGVCLIETQAVSAGPSPGNEQPPVSSGGGNAGQTADNAGETGETGDTTEDPEASGSIGKMGIMEIVNILLVLVPAWIF